MSAWTWTFVKSKCIPQDIVVKICDKALRDLSNLWYISANTTLDEKLDRWYKMHDENYDYYVNECGVDPSEMTHDKLKKSLYRIIKKANDKVTDLKLVKNGSMELDAYLRKHKVYKDGGLGEPYCKLIKNDVWVNVPEIFRLRVYSDMNIENGIKTIDRLLEYLSEKPKELLYDFQEKNSYENGIGLTDALRNRITEYYTQFGDGNFSVHFG